MDRPQASPFIPLEEVDPSKFSFASTVRSEAVTPEILAALQPQVTTYRAFAGLPGMDNSRLEEAGGEGKTLGDNWVYVYHRNAGSLHQFVFVAERTRVEQQRFIPSLSYVTSDRYPWPDVINSLRFVKDRRNPVEAIVDGEAVYLPRLLRRLSMIEGGSYPSLIRVRIYASHEPFDEGFFKLDPPVTGSVWWDLHPNQSGSIPSALHPYMEFPETVPVGFGDILDGAGTTTVPYVFGTKAEFPATNHLDWRDHVFYENVQQVQGIYMLEQREVVVPRGRRKLKNVT